MKGFGEEKMSKEELKKKKQRDLYIKTRFFEDVPFIGSDELKKKKKSKKREEK